MAENFDLIFGSSASQSYSWNDSDYQNGWQTVGDTPPTREQFDALQRRADLKTQELNNRLAPIETKAEADGRQAGTAYETGVMVTADGLPNGWLLECIVPGITGTGALEIPSPLVIGGTIVDGTVTWKLLNLAMGGVPVGYVTPFLQSTAPDGWLSCAGAEVSRTAYPDLWNYVNGSSQLISETDWQSKNTAGDINIGWFSSGDGTTTFRLPRIVGSGELTEVKRFTTAGDGSFVAPVTGIYKITLQGAGGGGGGAGVTSDAGSRGGGGGGAGGYGEIYERLVAGTTYTFTIGAGGGGGTGYTSSTPATGGGDGGDSSITINNNAYVATGGAGGGGGVGYEYSIAGRGGYFKINNTVHSQSQAGNPGNLLSNYWALGGTGGGVSGTAAPGSNNGGSTYAGSGGGGGTMRNSSTGWKGTNGGDGYIEFSYNPIPQYWYVRAFGSATNQGTIDITELANMLNAKLSISDVPKIAGFSGKQTFTSSGTFTPTVTGNYRITLQGGGGGGGGASNSSSWGYLGGGGGGAGAKIKFYERLTAGATYSFTIGAGGSGGTGANGSSSNGTSGGTSSITINDTLYSATGGDGGTGSAGAGTGGAGGVGSIGSTTVTQGTSGNSGACTSKNSAYPIGIGGNGGGETGGNGRSGDGAAGINGCGGAGGSVNTTTYSSGGAGGDGYITFEWQTASLV